MAPEAAVAVAPGTQVWVCTADGAWEAGTAIETDGANGKLLVRTAASGQTVAVDQSAACLANGHDDQDDMTHLTHLHEPGVLHNLEERYKKDKIYTCTGSILIAVNPFKLIPQLVGTKVMGHYQQQLMAADDSQQQTQLAPHVYATAVTAYKQMLRDGAGQAILITGESGAGKTESCKLIMRCLAHLGSQQLHSSSNTAAGGSGVEAKVLESNPLLEAFGNAKTSRNDNSSRFGKYVEIQFDSQGQLLGAAIRTYLLERSRVVHVVPGERSFHAFYQVCAGASAAERQAWHLGDTSQFSVLRQSPCRQLEGVDDAEEYQHTRRAMTSVGLTLQQQEGVFRTIAAILHLGNVQFAARWEDAPPQLAQQGGYTREACVGRCADALSPAGPEGWQALHWAAELLGVRGPQLLGALVTRTRQTPDGPITSPLTATGAGEARDALSKVVYARLFTWIVAAVNASLEQNKTAAAAAAANGNAAEPAANGYHTANGHATPRNHAVTANGVANGSPHTPPQHRVHSTGHLAPGDGMASANGEAQAGYTIGLLDIYGFESFEVNDLEQLCINLANEKLQQHFNQHVFKWEQAEYMREGVDWRYIDFVDNQEVLDLVEGRLGLLDLLDEQCKFPTATGADLANKYNSTPSVSGSKRFEKLKRVPNAFAIKHYAGAVNYKTDNFLDKNKDYVVAEHAALLGASTIPLLASLFAESTSQASANGTPAKSAFRFDSIASQFKRQLADLMATLHVMQPHYVRCIKPSPTNRPGVFDKRYVLNQLRCGGVMEAVRISCAGFPYKRPYHAFLDYFWQLCPLALHTALHQARGEAGHGLHHSLSDSDLHTNLRAAHQLLLQQADVAVLRAATQQVLQAVGVTGHHLGHTKLFMKSAQAAQLEKARALVLGKAATRVQAAWRGFSMRRQYLQMQAAALQLQCAVRGWRARALAERLRREKAATQIQAAYRACAARRQLHAAQQACTILQTAWRARAARVALQALQQERAACVLQAAWRARSVHRVFQQERAACVLQAAWRARSVHTMFVEQIRTCAAATLLQTAWRAAQGRRQHKQELVRVHAASKIQAAWRASRHGSQLRNKFRELVLFAVAAEKAIVVLQRGCRVRLAHKQRDQLQNGARRQRFQAQVERFQACLQHTAVVAGSGSLRMSPSYRLSPAGASTDTGRGLNRDVSRRKDVPTDVVRELDVEPVVALDPEAHAALRREQLQKEIAATGYKERHTSVLSMWQQMDAAAVNSKPQAPLRRRTNTAAASGRTTLSPRGTGSALTSPGGPAGTPQGPKDGLLTPRGAAGALAPAGAISATVSPTSVTSYGQLFEGGQSTV